MDEMKTTVSFQPMHTRLAEMLLHPYVLFCLIPLLVYLPQGFNIGPVNDGWIMLATTLKPHGLRVPDTTRIFGSFARSVGILISSDSFVGWQSVLLVLTILRGIIFYELGRLFLPGNRLFALVFGLCALFHPLDNMFFWVDASGIDLAFLALGLSCLCALAYLENGKRSYLVGAVLLQVVTAFSYTAFMLLMFAIPVGAWILRRMEGQRKSPLYLAEICTGPFVLLVVQAYLAARGVGREGKVLDLHAAKVLSGFDAQVHHLLPNLASVFEHFQPQYLLIVIAVSILGLGVAFLVERQTREAEAVEQPKRDIRFYAVLVLGLLALALVSYLPFAVSDVRNGDRRQMFAAGIFICTAVLVPFFCCLRGQPWPRRLQVVLVAVLALFVCATGLMKREPWVAQYRHQERLLAAVAQLVPDPPEQATIVVQLHSRPQSKLLAGFYNRKVAFMTALRFMYGRVAQDADKHEEKLGIRGTFAPVRGEPFSFSKDSLTVQNALHPKNSLTVPYAQLFVVDYPAEGEPRLLTRTELQALAPAGTDLSDYKPDAVAAAPDKRSIACTMFERRYRPDYCFPVR